MEPGRKGAKLSDSIANDIFRIAAAYKIPADRCDGMDVLAVYEATRAAVAHARAGNGPARGAGAYLEQKFFRLELICEAGNRCAA